jgi:asparagine synthase (glutamine-hydrolysing)
MCGISTLVSLKNHPISTEIITAMTDPIVHRGPDGFGYFCKNNFALGHRRLNIIDTTEAGAQPMTYGDYTIVFNGEIYNYIELRTELIAAGHIFCTQSDTEVLIRAYQAWGQDCLQRFNGMWAFVLYDASNETLFCSRDRFGVKPFVYTLTDDHFMVGSEVKQFFFKGSNVKANLNEKVTQRFLRDGQLNYNDETFFQGIQSLGAGHFLLYNLKTHDSTIQKWYQLPTEIDKSIRKTPLNEVKKQVFDLFKNSLKLRLRADVPIGSCLSGGMDSSSIVCMVRQIVGNEEPVYTLSTCYPNTPYDEQKYIDAVNTAQNGTSLKIFPDLNEAFENDLLDKMIWHQDQPINGMSHFSEYKVYEMAKQNNITVMLGGQGADEYLGGYTNFSRVYWLELLIQGRFHGLFSEIKAYVSIHKKSGYTPRGISVLFLKLCRQYLFKQINHPENIGLAEKWQFKPTVAEAQKNINTSIFSVSETMINNSSIPYQLHSEDRNSMMHSIESRVPFLDYHLVEYCLSLPSAFKIKRGVTKYILREALKDILPQKIYARNSKLGFPAPDIEWMIKNQAFFSAELFKAAQQYPAIFKADINTAFQNACQTQTNLNFYFRCYSLYRFLEIFKVALSPQ